MARSEEDRPTQDSSLDAGSPPADAPAANPGTEPHTTPGLTTNDRRTVDANAAAKSDGVVYDNRKQQAVDPHRASPPAADGAPLQEAVDKVLGAVEPRPSQTGTMGASGEHARLPARD